MKIKEQTRKLAAGCSKHCTKSAKNTVLRLQIELTKSVTYIRQGDVDAV
ncbi:lysyl-tRNA synthetase [Streptococcus pneumoniae]|nr:lysyl-tRNA synthetase [Streptococcus pneumoniae]